MGTQQLLLIAPGAIVLVLMVFGGISIMRAYSKSSNREQIIANMYDLGLMAQTYSKKHPKAGSSGSTCTGWTNPTVIKKYTYRHIYCRCTLDQSGSKL
ncbi:hypothetical protein C0389_08090 [bacterium]|nr:hypothetical protein [bacterium]